MLWEVFPTVPSIFMSVAALGKISTFKFLIRCALYPEVLDSEALFEISSVTFPVPWRLLSAKETSLIPSIKSWVPRDPLLSPDFKLLYLLLGSTFTFSILRIEVALSKFNLTEVEQK